MTSLTSAIASTSQTAATGSDSRALSQLSENFDDFLTILTAQLQNQDPLEPLDTHEFTNQLVLFTQAEQQVNINDKLEQLITQNDETVGVSLLNYIDKDVEVSGSQFQLTENGTFLSYTLPQDAREATINIFDSENRLIINQQVNSGEGRQEFFWDGADSFGNALDTGSYRFDIIANDLITGDALTVTQSSLGRVNGLIRDSDGNRLLIGDLEVPLSSVEVVLGERQQNTDTPTDGGI